MWGKKESCMIKWFSQEEEEKILFTWMRTRTIKEKQMTRAKPFLPFHCSYGNITKNLACHP